MTEVTPDHDLLVRLDQKIETLMGSIGDIAKRYEEINGRLVVLERDDSRDSERFKTIADQIKASLDNASKISALQKDVDNLAEKIRELKGKSYLLDAVNALGLVISAIYFKVTGG